MCMALFQGPAAERLPSAFYLNDSTQCSYGRILGASFGDEVVTRKVADLYNKGNKHINAYASTLGAEASSDGDRTFTVVLDLCGNVGVEVVGEGGSIELP